MKLSCIELALLGRSGNVVTDSIFPFSISSRHCIITCEHNESTGYEYRLSDISSYGTWINGKRLGKDPVAVSDGDTILLGKEVSYKLQHDVPTVDTCHGMGQPHTAQLFRRVFSDRVADALLNAGLVAHVGGKGLGRAVRELCADIDLATTTARVPESTLRAFLIRQGLGGAAAEWDADRDEALWVTARARPGAVVGAAVWRPWGEAGVLQVFGVGVAPKARRCGVATALLRLVEALAGKRGGFLLFPGP